MTDDNIILPKNDPLMEAKSNEDTTISSLWDDDAIVDLGKKIPISLRLDADLLEWYKAQPGRYQKRIQQVLRQYMLAKQQSSR